MLQLGDLYGNKRLIIRMKNTKIIKYTLILMVIMFFLSFSFKKNDRVLWHKRNIITWNDFRVVTQLSGNEKAITETHISNNGSKIKKDIIIFKINCYLSRNKSVVLNDVIEDNVISDNILKHEQGHFDITEIYARKIRRRLKKTIFTKNSFNNTVKSIWDKSLKELDAFQDLYDTQTEHSINKEKQAEWNKRIAQELAELDDYKDVEVICKIE